MTDEDKPPKKLNISNLIPQKVPVETVLGTLYLRYANASDLEFLVDDDTELLGKSAIQVCVNRVEDKEDYSHLSDEDFASLTQTDLQLLAQEITKRNKWGEVSADYGLAELGQAVKDAKQKEEEQYKKLLDDTRKTIDNSYAFLGSSSLDKLNQQIKDMADMRRYLPSGVDDILKASQAFDELEKTKRLAGLIDPIGLGPVESIERSFNMPFPHIRHLELPRPEDSPIGRATIDSAKHSQEVSRKMDALANVVGGLNQTLITEILPAWFKQVESEQKAAVENTKHARRSLTVTMWTMVVSVIVSFVVTAWQVSVTYKIDQGNTEQQEKTESLLKQQLEKQQQLIDQQKRDSDQLHELLQKQDSRVQQLTDALLLSQKQGRKKGEGI